jgi:signaling intermediate in Toll pathway protein
LHIEGPYLIWLRNKSINYFVLRGEPKPPLEEEEVDIDGESIICQKISRF